MNPGRVPVTPLVRHASTGAPGRIVATGGRFSRFDSHPGPWHSVRFDDGLGCWVPDDDLVSITEGTFT